MDGGVTVVAWGGGGAPQPPPEGGDDWGKWVGRPASPPLEGQEEGETPHPESWRGAALSR
jgi:hypothetical protein